MAKKPYGVICPKIRDKTGEYRCIGTHCACEQPYENTPAVKLLSVDEQIRLDYFKSFRLKEKCRREYLLK